MVLNIVRIRRTCPSGTVHSVNESNSYRYIATDIVISLCIPLSSESYLSELLERHCPPNNIFEVCIDHLTRYCIIDLTLLHITDVRRLEH